jgi:fatty acid desaturase
MTWQTATVATAIYGLWLLLTWFHEAIPWPVLALLGGWAIAWHGSLQHEATHGLVARDRRLNDALAAPPLSLWLPYPLYRQSHLAHHDTRILTLPWRDPESYYVDATTWARLPGAVRRVLLLHNTLLGRLTLGPLLVVGQFLWAEAKALRAGDPLSRQAWLWHLPAVALVLAWVVGVCGMPAWQYALCFALPGTSLTLLRSFAEHKALRTPEERTAIIEAGPLLSLLFLNNNLHWAHHSRPTLPWHALPGYYRRHRARLLTENGGLLYRGYTEVAGRFLLRPVDAPRHPFS